MTKRRASSGSLTNRGPATYRWPMPTDGATPTAKRGTEAANEDRASGHTNPTGRTTPRATERVTASSAHRPDGSLAERAAHRPADEPLAAATPFEVGQFENGGGIMYYEGHRRKGSGGPARD